MKRLIGLALIVSASGLCAALPWRGLPVTIQRPGQDPARYVFLNMMGDQVQATVFGDAVDPMQGTVEVKIPLAAIQSLALDASPVWDNLLAAAPSSSAAAADLTELALRAAFFAGISNSDTGDAAFQAAAVLGSAGRNAEARKILDVLLQRATPRDQPRAAAEKALLLCSLGDMRGAEAALVGMPTPSRTDAHFNTERIVQGRLAFEKKNYRESLDLFAQAYVRLAANDLRRAECLYYMASCYARIAESGDKKPEGADFAEVAKALFSDVVTFFPATLWAKRTTAETGISPAKLAGNKPPVVAPTPPPKPVPDIP